MKFITSEWKFDVFLDICTCLGNVAMYTCNK